jgi:hypothetical protein
VKRVSTMLAGLLLGACSLPGRTEWLNDSPAMAPVEAEPRASMMKVVVGAYAPYDFQENPGSTNIGMDLSVGKEIGIMTKTNASFDQVPLSKSQYRLSFLFPVSFHMLWDLNDASSAIVNNDYRFGGIIKYEHGIEKGWLDEWGIRYTPVMHESTHLGDELTLSGQLRNPTTFERINPSQYFTEILLSGRHIEDARGERKTQTIVRAGFDYSYTSLYGSDTMFTRNRRVIPEASARFQPILQFEHVHGPVMPSTGTLAIDRFDPFISADIRRSIVYDLEKRRSSDPDKHTVSVNVLIGMRRADRITRKGVSDFFVRGYYGVNPHGQFRTDPKFWLVGLGLALDP